MSPDLRRAVVDEARRWIGTPFVDGQACRGAGVDCGRFLAAVFEAVGIVPRVEVQHYAADWFRHRREEIIRGYLERYGARKVDEPLPGDVALFRYGHVLAHSAIVAAWPRVIHAFAKGHRAVVESDVLPSSDLGRRYAGCWSFLS